MKTIFGNWFVCSYNYNSTAAVWLHGIKNKHHYESDSVCDSFYLFFLTNIPVERIFVGRSHVARVAEARLEQINRYCQVLLWIYTHTKCAWSWIYRHNIIQYHVWCPTSMAISIIAKSSGTKSWICITNTILRMVQITPRILISYYMWHSPPLYSRLHGTQEIKHC